jgi:hypothetical protein
MTPLKDETLSIHTSAELKLPLRKATETQHRSVAPMIKILILNYTQQHSLRPNQPNHMNTQRKA